MLHKCESKGRLTAFVTLDVLLSDKQLLHGARFKLERTAPAQQPKTLLSLSFLLYTPRAGKTISSGQVVPDPVGQEVNGKPLCPFRVALSELAPLDTLHIDQKASIEAVQTQVSSLPAIHALLSPPVEAQQGGLLASAGAVASGLLGYVTGASSSEGKEEAKTLGREELEGVVVDPGRIRLSVLNADMQPGPILRKTARCAAAGVARVLTVITVSRVIRMVCCGTERGST